MWSVVDKISENVRLYSTPVAALWNVVTFVFRMFVVASVGSSVYGDEQGAFKCDTGQPGCQNVCFNRFSPISHMRFWAFQLLFVATPVLFFHMYAGKETGEVKLLEEAEEKQKKEQAKLAEQEKELESIAEGIESEFENGDHMSMISTQSMQKHDQLNLEIVKKKKQLELDQQKINKRKDKIGNYKKKEKIDLKKDSKVGTTEVIFTRRIKIVYVIHCFLKLGIEFLFLYLGYILQHQQSKAWGWAAWTVPEKYTCTHALEYGAAGSACAQQEKVTCWVSRPWEKQMFLYYMLFLTILSILLIILEALYMTTRVGIHSIQKRKNGTRYQKQMNETFANGGALPTYEADNMMTMLNQTNIRNSLSRMNAANKMRNSMMARKAAYANGNHPHNGYMYTEAAPMISPEFDEQGSLASGRKGTLRKNSSLNGQANGHALVVEENA